MPKPFPKEFRADVIAVARKVDQSIAHVARSFGASNSCLAFRLRIADREDGLAGNTSPSSTAAVSGDLEQEVRELRKEAQRLEQENEILRRATAYFALFGVRPDTAATLLRTAGDNAAR